MQRALITGVAGQAGSYLAEFLLDKGYEVHGLVRRTSSSTSLARIEHLRERVRLYEGDLLDEGCLARIITEAAPDEVYNLAAQSHVHTSFATPVYTCEVTGVGVVKLLEALRRTGCKARFYQASTSEMFGGLSDEPQNEKTPFHPRSPYGCAKLLAHAATVNAREAYGMHASCGILFNHEGPRRGEEFLTRKVTRAVARIALGVQHKVTLGNLEAKRDWGYAGDYVEAMWMMLQQPEGDDYVIASGESHSVLEFVKEAFDHVGLSWSGYVVSDPKFQRPSEVPALCGDASKARRILGWLPRTTFKELVALMVDADLQVERRLQGWLPTSAPMRVA